MPQTSALSLTDPRWIDGYRLLGRLGEGGQGVIYLAESTGAQPGQRVAVKVLHADLIRDPAAQARFMREVESARRVPQFFTARVLDAGMSEHGPFVVSELVEGVSLRRAINDDGPYDPDTLLRFAMGTASALATIHAAGVVHRDFKPSNVMLGPDGPRVIDFGTARSIDITTTRTASIVGSLPYMSPEQASGERVGTASDLFSWAVTIVFAATGGALFGEEFPGVLHRIINTDPTLPELPPPLDRLVPACLAKDPQQRPTASQVMLALVGEAAAEAADSGPAASVAPAAADDSTEPHVPAGSAALLAGRPSGRPWKGASSGPEDGYPLDRLSMKVAATAGSALRDRRRLSITAAALAIAVILSTVVAIASSGEPPQADPSLASEPIEEAGPPEGFNSALDEVVNEVDATGDTLRAGMGPPPASLDPGAMTTPDLWNVARLYSRSLVTFASAPGTEGLQLAPDLAEDLGEVSDDGLTWTYRLRDDITFEDGTPVTSSDVAHAVERSYDLANWVYHPDMVSGKIETPDKRTIEFTLGEPYAEFDYLMATPQSAPVPADEDSGEDYQEHVMSTGPYQFESHEVGEKLTLVRNPNWDEDNDPHRTAGPDRIEISFGEEADDIAGELLDGSLDTAVTLDGLPESAARSVLDDRKLTARADAPLTGALSYVALSTLVEPLDQQECREAVLHAVDRTAVLEAAGGETAGEAAGAILTPRDLGHREVTPEEPDPAQARQALEECGQPEGFSTAIAVRGDVPAEKRIAEEVRDNLAEVGIAAEIQEFDTEEFLTDYAGVPEYAEDNDLGLTVFTHRPWWPTGRLAMLARASGNWIADSGNLNFSGLDDDAINELFAESAEEPDTQAREEIYADLDQLVRDEAAILPLFYQKSLLFRPEPLANVYAHPVFGGYDLATLGVTG